MEKKIKTPVKVRTSLDPSELQVEDQAVKPNQFHLCSPKITNMPQRALQSVQYIQNQPFLDPHFNNGL